MHLPDLIRPAAPGAVWGGAGGMQSGTASGLPGSRRFGGRGSGLRVRHHGCICGWLRSGPAAASSRTVANTGLCGDSVVLSPRVAEGERRHQPR